jgi:hypothetical protein
MDLWRLKGISAKTIERLKMTHNRTWPNATTGTPFLPYGGYKCQTHGKCTVYRVGKHMFIHVKTIMQMVVSCPPHALTHSYSDLGGYEKY